MPRGVIDITIEGAAALERALDKLPDVAARKVLSKELRNSAKRLKPLIAARTPVDTGKLKRGMARAKIRSAAKKRGEIRIGLAMPTREELGIPADAKGYHPFMLEYGSIALGRAPVRWIRNTVNQNQEAELARIGRGIGQGVEDFWRQATRKAK